MTSNSVKQYFTKHKILVVITLLVLITIPLSVIALLTYRTSFPQAAHQGESSDKLCQGTVENIRFESECSEDTNGFSGMTYTCNDNATGTFFSDHCLEEQKLREVAEVICNKLGLPICKQSYGKAINLDGVESYMLSDNSFPATEQMSIEAWINPSSINKSPYQECNTIASRAYTGGFATWKFAVNPDNTITFIFETPEGGSLRFPSTSTIPVDQWSNVAFTFNKPNGTARLFIDGVQTDTFSVDPEFQFRENGAGVAVGTLVNQDGSNPRCLFSGQIDELRISNVERYIGLTSFPLDGPFTPDQYTTALWHFDQNGLDASGSNNHASPFGGLQYVESTIPINSVLPTGVIVPPTTTIEVNASGFVKNTNNYPKIALYVNYQDNTNNEPVVIWDTTNETQTFSYTTDQKVNNIAIGFSNQQYSLFFNRTSFAIINSVSVNENELAAADSSLSSFLLNGVSCEYDRGVSNRAFDHKNVQACQPQLFWNGVLQFTNLP